MAKRGSNFQDPRWAPWQVSCGGAPVGKPVWAVSENQAVKIILKQTGRVMIGSWTAKQIGPSLGELTSPAELAELREAFPRPRRRRLSCANCGYFDPSPMADICPSCGALRYQNPD